MNLSEQEQLLMKEILTTLAPYVIIVGSYGRDEAKPDSDIDLYVRRRPKHEMEEDYYGELEEHYIDKVNEVIEKYGITYSSSIVGHLALESLPIMIEASYLFSIPKTSRVHKITLFGVELDAAVDDKKTSYEDTIDYWE